jgi:hypothetical protein
MKEIRNLLILSSLFFCNSSSNSEIRKEERGPIEISIDDTGNLTEKHFFYVSAIIC